MGGGRCRGRQGLDHTGHQQSQDRGEFILIVRENQWSRVGHCWVFILFFSDFCGRRVERELWGGGQGQELKQGIS